MGYVLKQKRGMNILDKLRDMDAAEGVALMKQLFNPLRGHHVGYIGGRRGDQVRPMVEEEQIKMHEEALRRSPRQMDLFEGREAVHNRVQAQGKRDAKAAAGNGDQRTKGARV